MDIRSSQQHGYRQIDKANIKLLHFVSDGAHVRKHKKTKVCGKKRSKTYKIITGTLYIQLSSEPISRFLWQCPISLELQNGRQMLPSMLVRMTSSVDQTVIPNLHFVHVIKQNYNFTQVQKKRSWDVLILYGI